MEAPPIVSVLVSTYNHGAFIADAIEGILMQETSFPFEILIADDCSTDNTRQVIEGFYRLHPEKIRPLFSATNKGGHANFDRLYRESKGRYLALLEGDDYWTDEHKLQLLVDFLENNQDFALCFHNLEIRNDQKESKSRKVTNRNDPPVSGLERITRFNYIWTASLVFRNNLIEGLPPWVYALPLGDWPLVILLAEKGKIRYFEDVMGVYRVHQGGVWSKRSQQRRLINTVLVAETCRKHLGHPGFIDCIFKTSRTITIRNWGKGNYLRSFRYLAKCIWLVLWHPRYGIKTLKESRKHRRQASAAITEN